MKNTSALIIIDGFGYSKDESHNAIALAKTPTWDRLWQNYPKTLINCSGKYVGLPDNQMGNSEVGHMSIGSGRVVYQDLSRIDNDIESGEFYKNPTLTDLFNDTKNNSENNIDSNRNLHVIGLISEGGVHSHLRHYQALAKAAKQHGINNLYIHAFLDGRDTPPQSALSSLTTLDDYLKSNNIGKIVSLIGRYYAMDRDQRWDRIQTAYDLLTNNFSIDNNDYFIAPNIAAAIDQAYSRSETDEFIKATIISESQEEYAPFSLKNNDNVIFMNFRADRARQISKVLTDPKQKVHLNQFVTLTQYKADLTDTIVYRPQKFKNMLGEFLQDNNLTQLRIAETEKYAHVTFFLNGGRELPFKNEDRALIPSPNVATYDLKPEMSAAELTSELCSRIESGKYDVIICNYANPDMVGHTGSLDATIKAIETVDACLAQVDESINKVSGQMLVTADHGNAECMYNHKTKQPHTAHTTSLVPLVYVNSKYTTDDLEIKKQGALQDIAPTLLHLMDYTAPSEMTGTILFKTK